MIKRIFFTAAICGVLFLGIENRCFAASTQVDALIEKLVEKGVLSKEEARSVKVEIMEDEKIAREEGLKQNLPSWIQNTKIKGDLRLRYQNKHDKATNNASKDTSIGRVRMRLGLESKINEKLLAGIGIASGSGDPRSTNISFGGYNSKKTLVLDYAYAKYNPLSWVNFVGGKMLLNDAFWEPTDLIWDTDITPEGAIMQYSKKVSPNAEAFVNAGVLIVDTDSSTDNDSPMAYIVQPGINYKFNDGLSLKGAVSLQSLDNVKGHVSSSFSGASNTGNTTAGASSYVFDYSMFNPALELNIKNPLGSFGLNVDSLKLFGEYVDNLAVSKKSTGFSTGFKLGHEKIGKWGDWQFKYVYAMLGKDAVLDVLPDSDRYSGKTAMRSHEVELSFGLGKNTSLGFDIYRSERIGTAKAPETLAQVDWNMKF